MLICSKRIRIINKGRFIFSLTILLVIIISLISITIGLNTVSGNDSLITDSYIVKSGDTIWNIAKNITDETMDVRETVYAITKINSLKGDRHIYPGQELILPIFE